MCSALVFASALFNSEIVVPRARSLGCRGRQASELAELPDQDFCDPGFWRSRRLSSTTMSPSSEVGNLLQPGFEGLALMRGRRPWGRRRLSGASRNEVIAW